MASRNYDYEYRTVTIEPTDIDPAEYQRGRRSRYPETYMKQSPSLSSDRDYKRYKQQEQEARESSQRYYREKERYRIASNKDHIVDVDNVPEITYRPARQQLSRLEPQYHLELLEPSLAAQTSTRRHADARADFLELHPYAYSSLAKRDEHIGFMTNAYDDAKLFRHVTNGHMALAKSPGRRGLITDTPFGIEDSASGFRNRRGSDDYRQSRSRSRHPDGAEIVTIEPGRR